MTLTVASVERSIEFYSGKLAPRRCAPIAMLPSAITMSGGKIHRAPRAAGHQAPPRRSNAVIKTLNCFDAPQPSKTFSSPRRFYQARFTIVLEGPEERARIVFQRA